MNSLVIAALHAMMSFAAVTMIYALSLHKTIEKTLPIINTEFDFFVGLCSALLGHFLIPLLFRIRTIRNYVHVIWNVKIAVVFIFSVFYESHYKVLDAFKYFSMADSITYAFPRDLFSGTLNIVILTKFFKYLGFGSYFFCKTAYAFLGMIGLHFFYRTACLLNHIQEKPSYLLFIQLFPSLLFWSSILGKDPIIFFAFGLCFLSCARIVYTSAKIYWIALFAGLAGMALTRPWLPFLILPAALYFLSSKLSASMRLARWPLLVGSLLVGLTAFALQFGVYSSDQLLESINGFSAAFALGGSGQTYGVFTSIWDLFAYFPIGVFSALFRPFPWEIGNTFGFLAGMENFGLALLVLLSVLRFRLYKGGSDGLVWMALTLMGWSAAYSLISPFNLGTGFRFRAQILPVMLLWILTYVKPMIADSQRSAELR